MALSEKKRLLQEMYRDAPAAGAAAVPPPASSAPPFERRFDRFTIFLAHAGLYLLPLAGLAAIAWAIYSHYLAGLAFASTDRAGAYVRDFFRLGGTEIFLAFLAAGLFILFRDTLPKKWRWVPLSLMFVLIPLGPMSTFLMPPAFQHGRDEAYRRLDQRQLAADAMGICRLFPQSTNTPLVLRQADEDWSKLPAYTRGMDKIQAVEIYPRGVALRTESASWGSPGEAIVIPVPLLDEAAAARLAAKYGHTRVGDLPIFRTEGDAPIDEVYDPSQPPPPSTTMPF